MVAHKRRHVQVIVVIAYAAETVSTYSHGQTVCYPYARGILVQKSCTEARKSVMGSVVRGDCVESCADVLLALCARLELSFHLLVAIYSLQMQNITL
jgi:hypothetical protein